MKHLKTISPKGWREFLPPFSLKALIITLALVYITVNILDLATTQMVLAVGGIEINPFLADTVNSVGVGLYTISIKVAVVSGMFLSAFAGWKFLPRIRIALVISLAGESLIVAIAVINNVWQLVG